MKLKILIYFIFTINLFAFDVNYQLKKSDFLIGESNEIKVFLPILYRYSEIKIKVDTNKIKILNSHFFNNSNIITCKIIFSVYLPGQYITNFKFIIYDNNIILDSLETENIEFNVLPLKVNLNENPKDIKDPMNLEFSYLHYLIISTVLLIILSSVYFFINKIKLKNKKYSLEKKFKSPYHNAINKIIHLQAVDYDRSSYREYFQQFVDVIREYLMDELGINTFQLTSFKTIKEVQKFINDENLNKYLIDFFMRADIAKFSNEIPDTNIKKQMFYLAANILDIINKRAR
ncbi:MAG TPA: hypothetical protein PK887_09210 [Ignavibacteriales bacterium]|nr:hypothetical protein [Ignavibacteriales bacterium]